MTCVFTLYVGILVAMPIFGNNDRVQTAAIKRSYKLFRVHYTTIDPLNSSVGRATDMSSEGPVVQVPVTEV